jgi:hypothetical protein
MTMDDWAGTSARWLGILCVVIGCVMYVLTGKAEPVVFGTGGLLITGGAGAEIVSALKKPPAPPAPPEPPRTSTRPEEA